MPTSKNKSGFYIGVTCPGCGGQLEIESGFFVLTCTHCGSALRINQPEVPAFLVKSRLDKREIRFHADRYLKKNGLPLTSSNAEIDALYYPYWKIDAVMLKIRNKKITRYIAPTDSYETDLTFEQKKTEIRLDPYMVTVPAGDFPDNIPYSVGLRTEYIKMYPYSRSNIGAHFGAVPVTKSWSHALADLDKLCNNVANMTDPDFGLDRTEVFHPRGAIIFFPYFIVYFPVAGKSIRLTIDGLSGRVLGHQVAEDHDESRNVDSDSLMEFGNLEVQFHRCSNCAFDLPGDESFVYVCRNCQQLVWLENTPFQMNEIFIPEKLSRPEEPMFPFWSMKMSPVDRQRLQPHFGGLYRSDYLVIPAFKVPNFEAMYRLSKRISMACPRIDLVPLEKLERRFINVDLSLSEALIIAGIIIYRDRIGKRAVHQVENNSFQPGEVRLIYIPFHPQSYFYVDSILGGVTFEKNLISAR